MAIPIYQCFKKTFVKSLTIQEWFDLVPTYHQVQLTAHVGGPGALGPSLGQEPKVRCCLPGRREGLAAFQAKVPSYSNHHPPAPTEL